MPPKKGKTTNTTATPKHTGSISEINDQINNQINSQATEIIPNQVEDNTSMDNYISVNSSELERRIDDKDDKDSEISSIGKKSETEIKSLLKLAKTKKNKKIDTHSNIETIIFEENEEENDDKDKDFSNEKLKLGKAVSQRESIIYYINYLAKEKKAGKVKEVKQDNEKDVIQEMNLSRNNSENVTSSENNFSDYLKELRKAQFQSEGMFCIKNI